MITYINTEKNGKHETILGFTDRGEAEMAIVECRVMDDDGYRYTLSETACDGWDESNNT